MVSVRSKMKAELNTPTPVLAHTEPASTMSLMSTTTITPKAASNYRSVQNIIVGKNGELNVSEIDIGYVGDANVTKLTFDTSQLDWYQSNLNRYDAMLVFSDGVSEPLIYAFDGETFVIPQELTLSEKSFKVVMILKEVGVGNIENPEEAEIFVSSEIMTSVPKASHISIVDFTTLFTKKEEDEVMLSSLAKMSSKVVLEDNGGGSTTPQLSFTTNTDSFLGYNRDRYIKQIVVKKPSNFLSNIDKWFISFVNKEKQKSIAIKCFNDAASGDLVGWIVPEVTDNPGNWEIELIGTNATSFETVNEENVFYFSNIINGQIKSNFLNSIIVLEPNRGDSGGLYTSDNFYLVDKNGVTLYGGE